MRDMSYHESDSSLRLWRCYQCGQYLSYKQWCVCRWATNARAGGLDTWEECVEGPVDLSESEDEGDALPSTIAGCILHALGGTLCCKPNCYITQKPPVRLAEVDAWTPV